QHPGKGSAGELNKSILDLCDATYADMNDDFNAPKALARLFELVPKINGLRDGHLSFAELTPETIARLKEVFRSFIFDIFGLIDETKGGSNGSGALLDGLMDIIISLRKEARTNKDWTTADFIRNQLGELKVVLKDGKEGTSWTQEN
ncbi:MAG: DALR domain-containing protein, partial [Bacteroidota bacterium]